jgi:hypothetical protein
MGMYEFAALLIRAARAVRRPWRHVDVSSVHARNIDRRAEGRGPLLPNRASPGGSGHHAGSCKESSILQGDNIDGEREKTPDWSV